LNLSPKKTACAVYLESSADYDLDALGCCFELCASRLPRLLGSKITAWD
jgi:hypothetical protein